MNNIAKRAIADKLRTAIEKEGISKSEAARLLNFKNINYASQLLNEKQWSKCPGAAWEIVRSWINSGETLKIYSAIRKAAVTPHVPLHTYPKEPFIENKPTEPTKAVKAIDKALEELDKAGIKSPEPRGVMITDEGVGAFSVLLDVIKQLNDVGYEVTFEIKPKLSN